MGKQAWYAETATLCPQLHLLHDRRRSKEQDSYISHIKASKPFIVRELRLQLPIVHRIRIRNRSKSATSKLISRPPLFPQNPTTIAKQKQRFRPQGTRVFPFPSIPVIHAIHTKERHPRQTWATATYIKSDSGQNLPHPSPTTTSKHLLEKQCTPFPQGAHAPLSAREQRYFPPSNPTSCARLDRTHPRVWGWAINE